MSCEKEMFRIKKNQAFDNIPLSEIINHLEDFEKNCLDELFRIFYKLVKLGCKYDLIVSLSQNSFWEDDFFSRAGYLKLPLSFYLELLPEIINSNNFHYEIYKGVYGIYIKIIHSMDNKNISYEKELLIKDNK